MQNKLKHDDGEFLHVNDLRLLLMIEKESAARSFEDASKNDDEWWRKVQYRYKCQIEFIDALLKNIL